MKKNLLVIAILCSFLAAFAFSLDYSADLKIKTGDATLDLHLSNVNTASATPAGALKIKQEIAQDYGLTQNQIDFLSKQGYTLAEIQYFALLARQSGKPVDKVAALHSKGSGWGVLAKRLGVQPSVLRKLIVSRKKAEKTEKGSGIGGKKNPGH